MSEVAQDVVTEYGLHLADTALILGQRNAEWCGHGPILEEDLALANQALDLIGQARLLYQHVSNLRADGSTEDSLAYFRNAQAFRNYTLVELPHSTALAPTARGDRDYAVTIVRNFLYSALMVLLWQALQSSHDAQLAAIASKSLKEAKYHLAHASDWLIRFGDGTEVSHDKAQAAIDHLIPYTQEFWSESPMVADAHKRLRVADMATLKPPWDATVQSVLQAAGLRFSPASGHVPEGKHGVHSEHLGFVLTDMQSLAREHPGAQW
ncbi:MAG: phenylacetate-CoA oxygenase subunit PaaI [Betaproteobacteria bacterium]|nr:phenylacetate-CoA oxygenase subunit PaaI [Betaproteobacteria bacterium]